jgi:hypothetical protein
MHVLADPRPWESAATLTIVLPSIFRLVTHVSSKNMTGQISVSAVVNRC